MQCQASTIFSAHTHVERRVYGMASSRRDLPAAAIFVIFAPLFLEEIDSQIHPRGGLGALYTVIQYTVPGISYIGYGWCCACIRRGAPHQSNCSLLTAYFEIYSAVSSSTVVKSCERNGAIGKSAKVTSSHSKLSSTRYVDAKRKRQAD